MTTPNLLFVDSREDMMGTLLSRILQQKRQINARLVVDGSAGLAAIQAQPPDAVFIYLWAGTPDAIEFCRQLKSTPQTQHIPVVVWGVIARDEIYPKLRAVGAAGYLCQLGSLDEILRMYDAVMSGEEYYPID